MVLGAVSASTTVRGGPIAGPLTALLVPRPGGAGAGAGAVALAGWGAGGGGGAEQAAASQQPRMVILSAMRSGIEDASEARFCSMR